MSTHHLTTEYLERLRTQARDLPPQSRAELLADIESHLAEATSADMSNADVLTVLDRLGDPDEIVHAHTPDGLAGSTPKRGLQEWAAVFLLLLGGFVFGIGWIAGLILLWSSNAWRLREKWLGTLLLPGGLAAGIFLGLLGRAAATSAGRASRACRPVVYSGPGPNVVFFNGHELRTRHHFELACSSGWSTWANILAIACLVVAVLLPIVIAIHLARQASRSTPVAV